MQALGGAAVLAGAIELLARERGSHRSAARLWGTAGTIGLALGPAVGGVLTELLSWQSIFLLQAPLLLLIPFASQTNTLPTERGPIGPNQSAPEFALGLLSAGLTAALFLLVILLTEGWGLSPIAAAAVVTVIPIATVIMSRIEPAPKGSWIWALGGVIAVAGGLLALGVLPGATADLTLAPQLLIGAGLAMALPILTAAAVEVYDPDGSRAASTIAARHAGIVIGILVLTPILSAQLADQHEAGSAAGTALLLDADLSAETKVRVASEIDDAVQAADGQLPDLDPAFAAVRAEASPEELPAVARARDRRQRPARAGRDARLQPPVHGRGAVRAARADPDRNPRPLPRPRLAPRRAAWHRAAPGAGAATMRRWLPVILTLGRLARRHHRLPAGGRRLLQAAPGRGSMPAALRGGSRRTRCLRGHPALGAGRGCL